MSSPPLPLLLQSVLAAGGAVIGFCRAFGPGDCDGQRESPAILDLNRRVQQLELTQIGTATVSQAVTPLELAESLDRVSATFRGEIDSRFAAQDGAIESLRVMTAHTSELIERLLERMDAESGFDEPEGDDFVRGTEDSAFASFRK